MLGVAARVPGLRPGRVACQFDEHAGAPFEFLCSFQEPLPLPPALHLGVRPTLKRRATPGRRLVGRAVVAQRCARRRQTARESCVWRVPSRVRNQPHFHPYAAHAHPAALASQSSQPAISMTRTQSVLKVSLPERQLRLPLLASRCGRRRTARSSKTTAWPALPPANGGGKVSSGDPSSVRSMRPPAQNAETPGLGSKELKESLRENMLPRVLLQHLRRPAANPLLLSPSLATQRTARHLPGGAAYGHHRSHGNGQHPCSIDRPCIVWLPTAARVEGGLVQHHHTSGRPGPNTPST